MRIVLIVRRLSGQLVIPGLQPGFLLQHGGEGLVPDAFLILIAVKKALAEIFILLQFLPGGGLGKRPVKLL